MCFHSAFAIVVDILSLFKKRKSHSHPKLDGNTNWVTVGDILTMLYVVPIDFYLDIFYAIEYETHVKYIP